MGSWELRSAKIKQMRGLLRFSSSAPPKSPLEAEWNEGNGAFLEKIEFQDYFK